MKTHGLILRSSEIPAEPLRATPSTTPPTHVSNSDAISGAEMFPSSPVIVRPVAGFILLALIIELMALAFVLFWTL